MATITIKNGNLLKVVGTDDIWLPNPSSMNITIQDIDGESTGRNNKGKMFRDRVRGAATAPRKIECSFPLMSESDLSATLQAISASFFQLSYYDPYTGDTRQAEMYAGDRKVEYYSIINQEPLAALSVSFIER